MQNRPVQSATGTTSLPLMPFPRPANDTAEIARTVKKREKKVQNTDRFKMRTLAEAVILQAVEDLWSKTHRKKSLDFFLGSGFPHYADIAGMGKAERIKLLNLVGKSLG